MKFSNSQKHIQDIIETYAGHSDTMAKSLGYLSTVTMAQDKHKILNEMRVKGTISVLEHGNAAREINESLKQSFSMVESASKHLDSSEAYLNRKKNEHLNVLDNSAAVMVAMQFKADKSSDKYQGLKDPIVLDAISKAGSFISGVEKHTLDTSKDAYFSNHEDFIADADKLKADKDIFRVLQKALGKASALEGELTGIIQAGSEVRSKLG